MKNPTSEVLYENVNEQIGNRSLITYFSFINLIFPGVMFPNLIVSLSLRVRDVMALVWIFQCDL